MNATDPGFYVAILHERAEAADTLARQLEAERDRNTRLVDRLNSARQRRIAALSNASRLRTELRQLRIEHASCEPQTPSGAIPVYPRFLEVSRAARYLSSLFDTGDERDAVLANQALTYIARMLAEIERVRPELKREES